MSWCPSNNPSVGLCAEWVVVLNRGIPASDLDCKPAAAAVGAAAALAKESGPRPSSSSGCRVCGGAPAVAAACSANPKCGVFVMDETAPGCGDLKSGYAGQVTSLTQSVYCNTAREGKCAGAHAFGARGWWGGGLDNGWCGASQHFRGVERGG